MDQAINFIFRCVYKAAYKLALCYWFVVRPTARAAYVAVWWDGKILVIKNSYKRVFTLPAGCLKRGETSAQAAVRELREEVGLSVGLADLKFAGNFVSREEFKHDSSDVFEVTLGQEPAIRADQREVSSAAFTDLAAARNLPLASIARQYLQQCDAGIS